MRHWKTALAVMAMATALAVTAAAQMASRIQGTVKGPDGKPWAGITVEITNQRTGTKYTTKTDDHGNYRQVGLEPGNYTITFITEKFPPQKYAVSVDPNAQATQDIDYKKLLEANPGYLEAVKKQEAQKKQFAQLKLHFTAGRKAIDQINALRQQMHAQPATQQAQTQQQISQLSQTAVTELSQAEQIAGPKDKNLPTIVGNLALAYELGGKHAEAAETYTKAAALQPANPELLLGAATNLAYAGKLDEASADCEKVATMSAPDAGTCWRNLGVVLYNTNHLQEAVTPLQKATKADPSNADTWYLLGTALMNTMKSKMVNGKLTAIISPGTVDAYQKYLDLAPNGPHADEAKQALQVLQQLGAGVDTKYIAPKKH